MKQPQPPSHFLEARRGDGESTVSLAGQEAPSVAMAPVDTVTPVRTGTARTLRATSIKQRAPATHLPSAGASGERGAGMPAAQEEVGHGLRTK